MPDASRPVSLYLEFRREEYGQQFLFTPQLPYMKNGGTVVVPAQFYSRQLSTDHPRRQWKLKTVPLGSFGASQLLASDSSYADSIKLQNQGLEDFATLVSAIIDQRWTLVGVPLLVEIGEDDIADLYATNPPSALIRRMGRAREEAKFPAEFWDDKYVASAAL